MKLLRAGRSRPLEIDVQKPNEFNERRSVGQSGRHRSAVHLPELGNQAHLRNLLRKLRLEPSGPQLPVEKSGLVGLQALLSAWTGQKFGRDLRLQGRQVPQAWSELGIAPSQDGVPSRREGLRVE